MTFAGINYIAVLVAGSVAWIFGGIWYRLLAKPWMEAHGFTSEQVRTHHGNGRAMWPLIVSFTADLIMAWTLAGLLGHFGAVTFKNGVISAAFIWFGFVITTLAVNNIFGMRRHSLILIDGGHWLGALLLTGAIIGAWGV
jgi:Protein of unknown function (DUF1761)